MDKHVDAAIRAARQAAKRLVELQGAVEAQEKAPKDLVSKADFEAQQIIYDVLMDFDPTIGFLGEESLPSMPSLSVAALENRGTVWVVDPLDGTMNYLHQLPGFAVSIGMIQDGEPQLGVIYDPLLDELFVSRRGDGATCNGKPIRASQCEELERALLVASLPSTVKHDSIELARFVEATVRSRAVRRLGSAALNLCYVAAGRLDAYWATTINAWDIAAGVSICQEAGCRLSDLSGEKIRWQKPEFVVSATEKLHLRLLALLRSVDDKQNT